MGISIKNDKAEKLARQVASEAGEPEFAETLLQIGRRCSALPDLDIRNTDEILGYDENGAFR